MAVKLGNKVRDTVTGFEGVAIAKHEFLHGCVRISVQPQSLHDGKPVEAQVFDEPQLDLVEESKPVVAAHAVGSRPGGDHKVAAQRSVPSR